MAHAQAVIETWRQDYNHVRPHSALQDRTPVDGYDVGQLGKIRLETEIADRLVTIPTYRICGAGQKPEDLTLST